MRETPKELQVYRHFKGSLYQIVAIAIHTETTDKLVIYRSLTNPERVFARPLEMFLSEVNHKKYPDIKAKYRFTLLDEIENETADAPVVTPAKEPVTEPAVKPAAEPIKEAIVKPAAEPIKEPAAESVAESVQPQQNPEDSDDTKKYRDDGTLVLDPTVERLLDSKEFTDKIEAFELLRGKCTEDMLSTIAMALDIQLSGDTLEEKYADILRCLKMHQKYETNRLR